MHGGGNRIYGRHMIIYIYITYSLQNAKSLKIFKDYVVQGQVLEVQGQGQGLVNWSTRTRTFLEDNNIASDDKPRSEGLLNTVLGAE